MESKNKSEERHKVNMVKKSQLKQKTGPPVRHTLTSYKRLMKANPLLMFQNAGIDTNELFAQRSQDSTSSKATTATTDLEFNGVSQSNKPKHDGLAKQKNNLLLRTQSLRLPKSNNAYVGFKRPTIIISSCQAHMDNNNLKRTKPASDAVDGATSRKAPVSTSVKAKVNSFPKVPSNPKIMDCNKPHKLKENHVSKLKKSVLRRSKSSNSIQGKKELTIELNKSQSEESLCSSASKMFPDVSPTMECREYSFKTPSAYNRRSVCQYTPRSNRKTNLFHASTPAPIEMQRLQERLNKWLISRGKPPASFHHLKVFGSNEIKTTTPPQFSDDNKENFEVINEKSESYEDLKIKTSPKLEITEEPVMSEEEISKHAKEAMADLLKLIEEDYPRQQCIAWVDLIKEKCKTIVDEPEYWECKAAIEQSAGNVHMAVEYYKTAIIQGAEVTYVDKSLDQLLHKFSLLNINSEQSDGCNRRHIEKERIAREARNVFKSSIIQFAIQERNLKKQAKETPSKKLVAIPVRRSTRLSRSGYINTSGVKLCNSLRELNLSSEEISFEKNQALC